MSGCDCTVENRAGGNPTAEQRRTLRVALLLNAIMFMVELVGGILGDSSGLIADSLDMLADASAYAIGLAAIGRATRFKARAAALSGFLLLGLGLGAVVSAVLKAIHGSDPESLIMAGTSTLALAVNASVLRMLWRYRTGEVHLRATWIFTRADVVANLAVIAAASLVALFQSRFPDLIVGFAIGLYVCREAVEILWGARRASKDGQAAEAGRRPEAGL